MKKNTCPKGFFLLILLSMMSCVSRNLDDVRSMGINEINLAALKDGDYTGAYTYGGFEYKVKTTIMDHKIINIDILQNRDTSHARNAAAVIELILEKQTPNVDAITGATTTSKALMKAVENSLSVNSEN